MRWSIKHGLRALLKRQKRPWSSQVVKQPLLSVHAMAELAQQLDQLSASLLKLHANPKLSDAQRQGEQVSRFMGAGLEYEESRLYEAGDEIRRINWRMVAKTGHYFTKLYQEERQENWFILVDQGASMRFGTHTRLKATQALRVAGFYAWLGAQRNVPIAAGRLAENFQESPLYEGRSSYMHVMQFLSQACPPMSAAGRRQQPALEEVLMRCSQQLPQGSRVIVISDFQNLSNQAEKVFTALRQRFSLKAVWIQDKTEKQLPSLAGLHCQALESDTPIDMSSQTQKQAYQDWSQHYFQHQAHKLRRAGLEVFPLDAAVSVTQIAVTLSGPADISAKAFKVDA